MKRSVFLAAVATLVPTAVFSLTIPEPVSFRNAPAARPERDPTPLVHSSRPVLHAAVSRDGKWIATVEKGDGGFEIWVHATDRTTPPRFLHRERSRIGSVALDRNGSRLAFVDTSRDVKGDIALLETGGSAAPRIITTSDTGDDSPAFFPDGSLIVQQETPGEGIRRLVRVDPSTGTGRPLPVDRDAASPAVSPDGTRIAFVSRDQEGNTDLFLLEGGSVQRLTASPQQELHPAFADDGTLLYTRVTRSPAGVLTPTLRRLSVAGGENPFRRDLPLTSERIGGIAPLPLPGGVAFIRERGEGGILLRLPAEGELPPPATLSEGLARARRIGERRPFDPSLTDDAYALALSLDSPPSVEGGEGGIERARLLIEGGRTTDARELLTTLAERYRSHDRISRTALLLREELELEERLGAGGNDPAATLSGGVERVERIAAGADGVTLLARLIQGRLLVTYGSAADLERGMNLLREAASSSDPEVGIAASLQLARAEHAAGGLEGARERLTRIASDPAVPERWGDRAISLLLDLVSGGGKETKPLAALAERYRTSSPRIAAWCWNRIGDIHLRENERARARDAYRTVLEQIPPAGSATAAARFALAELLYQEGRYAEAKGLYETDLSTRPEESSIYLLARRAYLRKSIAGGELLLRQGEAGAARSLFHDLLTYDGRSLEATRGYVRSVAAQGEAAELVAAYRDLLARHPDDPVVLYGLGLSLTWLPGKGALQEADLLLERAAARMPESEYPFQTRGYVAEVMETVHGERGGLERAMELYRRALLLNDPEENRENRANLELNVGNVAYLLGSTATARRHYQARLESGVPFDDPDTELLFHRRLARTAFLMGEKEMPVTAYETALRLTDARIDPSRPLDLFGKLARRVVERLFAPPVRDQGAVDRQEAIATALTRIGKDLPSRLPDPRWEGISRELSQQLERQREIVEGARVWNRQGYGEFRGELAGMASAVERSLAQIPRLLETRAEILDRLGLALYEAGRYADAARRFDEAYRMNEALGIVENLAPTRRSGSLARFAQAASESGETRRRLLKESEAGFREVLSLLDRYPHRTKKGESRGGGVVSVSLSVSLDRLSGTEAAYGFSTEQERRLAETFLARIAAEEGRIADARTAFERLAKRYPAELEKVSPGDLFGVGLIAHRQGHLLLADGELQGAFDRFERSARSALLLGNAVGAMTGSVDAGLLLPRLGEESRRRFIPLLAEVDRFVIPRAETIPFPRVNRWLGETGAILLSLARQSDDPVERWGLTSRGIERLIRARFGLEEGERTGDPEVARLAAALRLNLAAATDLPEERQRLLAPLLPGSGSPLHSPSHAWRALTLLERYDEALEILSTLPPPWFDATEGEIVARFAPHLLRISHADPEKGFALLERLSEEERLQITVPPLLGLDDPTLRESLREASVRLAEIARHEGESDPSRKEYALLRIAQEREILDRTLGKERQTLPPLYRLLGDRLVRLAGETGPKERQEFSRLCRKGALDQLCHLLVPSPVELIDVQEGFPDRRVVRFAPLPDGGWLLFDIDGTRGVISRVVDTAGLIRILETPGIITAGEEIGRLSAGRRITGGVSASHLVRSLLSRRPFRSRVVDPAGWFPPADGFTVERTDDPAKVPFAHVLTVAGRGGLLYAPPSREGEGGSRRPMVEVSRDGRRHLLTLAEARNLSLLLVPPAVRDEIVPLAHLTSLLGIPSILVTDSPLPPGFVQSWRENSLEKAAGGNLPAFLLLGDPGVDADGARKVARARFDSQVREAVRLFNEKRWRESLVLFGDAAGIAREVKELASYRIPLTKQAREAAYLAGETERAIQEGETLLKLVSKEKPYSPDHAEALLSLGILMGKVERFGEAEKLLSEAVSLYEELGMAKEAALSLSEFGAVMENGVNYEAAGDLFRRSAEAGKGDRRHIADQHRNLGRLLDLRLSRYGDAIEQYRKAHDIYRELGDRRMMAETLLEEGRCRRLLGDFTGAGERYAEALTLVGEGDRRLEGRIRLEQGNTHWFRGEYQQAFDLRERVEKSARENGWDLDLLMAKNTGGLIWWTLGNRDRALTELDEALEIARRTGRRDEIATTLNNRGLVLRESGRHRQALDALEEALAIDRSLKSKWGIAYDLRNIAMTRMTMGDPAGALPLLEEAGRLAGEIGDRVNLAKVKLAQGDLHLSTGDLPRATAAYADAVAAAEGMGVKEVIWRGLLGKGRIARRSGDLRGARQLLERGVEIVEGMRAEIRLDQLKDGFLSDKIDLYRELVSLLVQQGETVDAFGVAERSRARTLIDLLGRQRLSLAGNVPNELFQRQQRLKEQIEEQEKLLAQSPPDRRELFQSGVERLKGAYQDLLIEIERSRPELLSLVAVRPFTVAQLKDLLEPGVTILSYYLLDDRLLCWRIGKQRTDLVQIPLKPAELEDLIGRYRRMLQNLEPYEGVSRRLFDLVAREALRGIPDGETVGIVPHGPLHYLAFATLFDGDRFLIERHPLFHLPAASVLSHTLSRRASGKNRAVLAIGNPDLKDPSLELPFAEREAGTLKWRYPEVTILTRERATESWVRGNVGRFGIIHLATHGEFDPLNPLFSSIRLARDPSTDGRLQADEVFGLEISADLVVLSACQSGLGEITRGDDVVGMNRAFLYAGTHALLSSLWRVSDVSTAILMKQFYREYADTDKAPSLRRAMLHVKNRYPHPGYWGAFTLTGDYR